MRSAAQPPGGGLVEPRCWGVGISRTGTNSLCEALRILGYRNVAHNPPYADLRTLDGGSDLGVLLFYKYLDFVFPGSRFVQTVRPLEDWLPSMEYILAKFPANAQNDVAVMRRMGVLGTVRYDRERLIDAYHLHHEDVRRYFRHRPGDLLVMNIVSGDGWEVLCPFLGRPVPAVPFPSLNGRPKATA